MFSGVVIILISLSLSVSAPKSSFFHDLNYRLVQGSPGWKPNGLYSQVPDTPLSSSGGLHNSRKFPGGVTLSPEAAARVWTPSTVDSTYLSPQSKSWFERVLIMMGMWVNNMCW